MNAYFLCFSFNDFKYNWVNVRLDFNKNVFNNL